MIRKLSGLSLNLKFTSVFLLAVVLVGLAYVLMLRNVYHSQLQNQARTVADNVESFGSWVSQYGRVWVKDDDSSFLGSLKAITSDSAIRRQGEIATVRNPHEVQFYSKNPALAQREFSEVVARSRSPARFRMTSDNNMNPSNAPDGFEGSAIARVKKESLKEYWTIRGGNFRYARTLYHKESCIACHGDAAAAPTDVTTRYGKLNGFGFKVGDVAGIISVTIPAIPFWQASLQVFGFVEAALVITAFVIAYLFISIGVVRPINELTLTAEKLSIGESVDMDTSDLDVASHNEIQQLKYAVYRLRTSLQLAILRMKGQLGKT